MLTQAQPGGRFMPPFFIWVFYCAKHQDTPAYNNTQLLPQAGTPRRWEQLWPQEGAWELGGSPLVFVVFVINRCCGSLSRLLLESMWIFTISDYSSAGVTGKSDCASWGWPEGLLSHHSLRTGLWNWKQTQEWRTGAEGSLQRPVSEISMNLDNEWVEGRQGEWPRPWCSHPKDLLAS